MPPVTQPGVAGNRYLSGYGPPGAVGPDKRVMSSWLPITFVGSAAATGVIASPGPTITYTSTGGNTLVLAGTVQATGSGGLSAASGITSITDTAGNVWQFSTGNSQFPPSAYATDGNGYIAFVAWCVNAAAVTSVTVTDASGFSDTWNLSLSEWAGVTWADYGVAGTAVPGGSASAAITVPCSTPMDLIVVAMRPVSGNTVSTDPGVSLVQLPGTTQISAHKVIGSQILSSIAPPGFVFVGATAQSFTGLTGALSLTPPPDLVNGDLIIFDVLCAGGGTVSAWPAGFTQQLAFTGVNDATNQRFVATKLSDGTEGSTLTATVTGAANGCSLTYGLRGAASATPANTGTYTQSGFTTSAPSAALTINGTTDGTVYGYAGCTSGQTGTVVVTPAGLGTLLNTGNSTTAGHGCSASIAWGTDVAAPGTITGISTAVDVLDWAMDFPLRPLGIGGQVTYTWTMAGSVSNAMAAVSFGPAGVPVAVQPGMQAF